MQVDTGVTELPSALLRFQDRRKFAAKVGNVVPDHIPHDLEVDSDVVVGEAVAHARH